MMTAAILMTAAALQEPPEKMVFKDEALDLSLEHPADWEIRTTRLSTVMVFPLKDGSSAEVRLTNTRFRDKKEVWQDLQKQIAESMNRPVDKQWEELILSVPLLMTRLIYEESGVSKTTLVGLLYSKNAEKLNFRLTSSSAASSEAEQTWRQTLNTLRTLSGELPEREDGQGTATSTTGTDAGSNTASTDDPEDKPTYTYKPDDGANKKLVKGKIAAKVTLASKNYTLYMPEGWSLVTESGSTSLKHKDFNGTLGIKFRICTEREAASAVLAASLDSVHRFKSVAVRDEPRPSTTKAGCQLARIKRSGEGEDNPLVIEHLSGWREGKAWIIEYEGREEAQKNDALLKKLYSLLVLEDAE
jgi:hypothetical protein